MIFLLGQTLLVSCASAKIQNCSWQFWSSRGVDLFAHLAVEIFWFVASINQLGKTVHCFVFVWTSATVLLQTYVLLTQLKLNSVLILRHICLVRLWCVLCIWVVLEFLFKSLCRHTYIPTYMQYICMHTYLHTYRHACILVHTYTHTYAHYAYSTVHASTYVHT